MRVYRFITVWVIVVSIIAVASEDGKSKGTNDGDNLPESIFDVARKAARKDKPTNSMAAFFRGTKEIPNDNSRCPAQQTWLKLFRESDVPAKHKGSVASSKQNYRIIDIGFNKGYNFANWLSIFTPERGIDTVQWYQALKKVSSLEAATDLCGSCNECKAPAALNVTADKSHKPPAIHFVGVDLNIANVEAVESLAYEFSNASTFDLLNGAAIGKSIHSLIKVPVCDAGSDHCRVHDHNKVVRMAIVGDIGQLVLKFGAIYGDQRRRLQAQSRLETYQRAAARPPGYNSQAMQAAIQTNQRSHAAAVTPNTPPARSSPQRPTTTAEQIRQIKLQQQLQAARQHPPEQQQIQQRQQQLHQQQQQQLQRQPQLQQPPLQQQRLQPQQLRQQQQQQLQQQHNQQQQHRQQQVQVQAAPTPAVPETAQPNSLPTPAPLALTPEEAELARVRAAEVAAQEVIDILRISTGGDEPPILQSAFGVFEARRVRAVSFEYSNSSAWQETTLGQMVQALGNFNLACYFQGQERLWALPSMVWNEQYEIQSESNVLCVLRSDVWFHAIQRIVVTESTVLD